MRNIINIAMLAMALTIYAQNSTSPKLHRPLNIPLVLSANFGELRSNHFHSGLDFKTQGKTGLPIFCADDGYVSRVLVSPWGFGRAIYVVHPATGLTTVYGHLSSFCTKIDRPVREAQYSQESFRIDLEFKPGEIIVKKGEQIALSGNSGSSGGPHLHMDVRDTESGDALDPLPYFKKHITDNRSPIVNALALYPVKGEGHVYNKQTHTSKTLATPFTAWGKVIPAIKAYDKMTGTTNIYGIKHLSLVVDGDTVYSRHIYRIPFESTRAINTIINYAELVNNKSWMMTTRTPDNSMLDYMITTIDEGILTIDEERQYKCKWVLKDAYNNITTQSFVINGKQTETTPYSPTGDLFNHQGQNTYCIEGSTATFDSGTFYEDYHFTASSTPSQRYFSDIVTFGEKTTPLHKSFRFEIDIKNDSLPDKSKYCIVRTNPGNTAVGGKYSDGKMIGASNRLGSYAVSCDTVAPVIRPINQPKWAQRGRITVKISDNLSGIETYRGEIDGTFILLELDGKTGRASYKLDNKRVRRGKHHKLKIQVIDACGNSSTKTFSFKW